jgi:hypothetical protein
MMRMNAVDYRRLGCLALLLGMALAMPAAAYTWPFDGKKDKAESGKPAPKAGSKPEAPALKTKDATEKAPDWQEVKVPAERTRRLNKAAQINQDVQTREIMQRRQVADVNRQIQEIIRINENMKTSQRAQAAEVQRISEQARIHQQILQDLENAKRSRNTVQAGDVSEILRQEKIRLIREQTERNRQVMENLERSKRIAQR